ncbi:MAG: GntR family transcriptional regulator [Elusimicrobiales bacterium]
MIKIDPALPVPINEQIKSAVKGLVARGLLRPGDKAPSVRALALELKVNPNTVARAMHELTLENILEARRGEGAFISAEAPRKSARIIKEAAAGFAEALQLARRAGLSWADIDVEISKCRREEK